VRQRQEDAVGLEVGEVEARDPAHGGEGVVAGAQQRLAQGPQLALARQPVEAAQAHVDRVDLAAAEHHHDVVADLLQAQAPLDDLAVVLRQVDAAGVAEEVGRVQHVDVQRVALDPLAAVEQPPQLAQLGRRR
jgi:hypothetical protein